MFGFFFFPSSESARAIKKFEYRKKRKSCHLCELIGVTEIKTEHTKDKINGIQLASDPQGL